MDAPGWVRWAEWFFRVFIIIAFGIAVAMFITSGASGFEDPEAQGVVSALDAAGLYPLLVVAEGAVALMLLVDRLVPLGAILAAPLAGSIALFNMLVSGETIGMLMGSLLVISVAFLLWSRRAAIVALLSPPPAGTPAGTARG